LVGCAATSTIVPRLQREAPGLPPRVHLGDTPFVPQDDTLCGPAVLAMLLGAAGRPVSVDSLTPQVYLPGRRGSLQTEMLATARRHGALAMTVPGGLAGAFTELAAGHPVAALVNLSLPAWPRWHYLVLTGHDLLQGDVTVHSGLQRDARWTLATLDHVWARSGHWGFVALGPGRLPATASEPETVRALLALDRVAPARDAAPGWSAAADRWPDSLSLAVGEASAWQAAGDTTRARQRLAQAAPRLDRAVAWNNLAMLHLQAGDRAGAQDAALRAVARAEAAEPRWLDATRRTLAQITPP